jgi:hypothetical protein
MLFYIFLTTAIEEIKRPRETVISGKKNQSTLHQGSNPPPQEQPLVECILNTIKIPVAIKISPNDNQR